MGRKTIDYTIPTEGRDLGKTFAIREMSAAQAERWALRAIRALASSGVDIGDVENLGMEQISMLGLQALAQIPFEEASILLDEMFECISIRPDPKNKNVIRPLVDDDIEEVATRLLLRKECFLLHANFSKAANASTSA